MIFRYVSVFIFGVMLAALLYFLFYGLSMKKKYEISQKELWNCVHAPVRIDTVHDSIIIYNPHVFKPIPSSYVPEPQPDPPISSTALQDHQESVCTQRYDQSYSFKGGRLRWTAYIKNCIIEEMSFPEIVAPKELIYITKTVDTCIMEDIKKQPFIRFGPYIEITGNSFDNFPGLGIGGQVVVNDQFTLGVGYQYIDASYLNIRLGWLFKK
jgi:hypothetical protein